MIRSSLIAAAAIVAAVIGPVARAEVPLFSEQTPPPAPDYGVAGSWAAGPFGPGASAAVPAGASRPPAHPRADVFYIHPTTFRSPDHWNQDLADAATNAWTDASVIARQASAFGGCCRIFAPRYRQAAFLNRDGGRDLALRLAYGDVERAFDGYLAQANHGRPVNLAGHSQGGWIIAELLERRIDGTALQKRMIAAYIIGNNVAEGEFGQRFKHVPVCETPAQTGCAVQWNAVLPSANIGAMVAQYQSTFVKRFGDGPGKATVCVNPLTFDRRRPIGAAVLSKGAVPGDPGLGAPRPLVRGQVSARCEQGLLVVEPTAALELKPLPGGVMHYHDIGLFYGDVRANAVLRTDAWFKAHRARK